MTPGNKTKRARRGRPKELQRLKRVTLTLHPDDWAQFMALADESGQSTAALIRFSMREFLDRRRDGRALAMKLGVKKQG